MFLSIERRSQLSFVSTNITDDSRFRLSVAWVVGVTRARASRLDSRPAREAPADHRYENTRLSSFFFFIIYYWLVIGISQVG